jgi:hypothetical protein
VVGGLLKDHRIGIHVHLIDRAVGRDLHPRVVLRTLAGTHERVRTPRGSAVGRRTEDHAVALTVRAELGVTGRQLIDIGGTGIGCHVRLPVVRGTPERLGGETGRRRRRTGRRRARRLGIRDMVGRDAVPGLARKPGCSPGKHHRDAEDADRDDEHTEKNALKHVSPSPPGSPVRMCASISVRSRAGNRSGGRNWRRIDHGLRS